MARLVAVHPISGEDTNALPVKALDPAIAFYHQVLGFTLVRRGSSAALLSRDTAVLGLVVKPDHEPKEAGSVAFEVDDLDDMHRELQASGARPGQFGLDEWAGRSHRTFFVREEQDGYCYCFYQPQPPAESQAR